MSTQKNEHNPETELKPCPFCGSANIECAITIVDCRDCGAQADNAVIWNRRITPPTDTTGSGREGETPETDAEIDALETLDRNAAWVGLKRFARQLERQRDAALAQLEGRRSEAEALQRFIQTIEKAVPGVGLPNPIDSAESKLVQLVAQVEALRRDGERLEWLETQLRLNGAGPMYWFGQGYYRGPFRAAIDSAQRQEKP